MKVIGGVYAANEKIQNKNTHSMTRLLNKLKSKRKRSKWVLTSGENQLTMKKASGFRFKQSG